MTKGEDVKIAIVGAGAIASLAHIPVWKKIPSSKIVGIFDIDEETRVRIANKHKIPKVYTSLEDTVTDPDVDLIDVCTPIHTHVSIIETALNANKHVVTEKPLAPKSEDAERLIKLSNEKNLVLGVSQNHLYSNAIRTLKRKMDEGYLGDPLVSTITFPLSIYKSDHWTANPKTGGLLFELGIHPAYIAAYLFGKPERIHAFGNVPSPDVKPGWVSIILERNKRIFNINLGPVEDQPMMRMMGSAGYAVVNLFADSVFFSKKTTMLEWGKTSMHSMTSTGLKATRNWLALSTKFSSSYVHRGLKYWISKHRVLNQFTFFKEILSQIGTDDVSIKDNNKRYLEVAVESIRILEQVKLALMG